MSPILKQFGIRFIRQQQLEVYSRRNFCSSKRPPKFEGGERNFFQHDKSVPPKFNSNVRLLLGVRIFIAIGLTILCLPFGNAYLIEVDPKRFDNLLFPALQHDLERNAKEIGVKLSEEQVEGFKQKVRSSYDPYITILRTLGITSARDDGWKKNDEESNNFGNEYIGDGNNQNIDVYDFGNNDFDDPRSGSSDYGREKSKTSDEKAW